MGDANKDNRDRWGGEGDGGDGDGGGDGGARHGHHTVAAQQQLQQTSGSGFLGRTIGGLFSGWGGSAFPPTAASASMSAAPAVETYESEDSGNLIYKPTATRPVRGSSPSAAIIEELAKNTPTQSRENSPGSGGKEKKTAFDHEAAEAVEDAMTHTVTQTQLAPPPNPATFAVSDTDAKFEASYNMNQMLDAEEAERKGEQLLQQAQEQVAVAGKKSGNLRGLAGKIFLQHAYGNRNWGPPQVELEEDWKDLASTSSRPNTLVSSDEDEGAPGLTLEDVMRDAHNHGVQQRSATMRDAHNHGVYQQRSAT